MDIETVPPLNDSRKRILLIIVGSVVVLAFVVLAAVYSQYLGAKVAPGKKFKILGPFTITAGQVATITWDASLEIAKQYPFEKIEYCYGALLKRKCVTLASAAPSNGKAIVKVPASLPAGKGYYKFTVRDPKWKLFWGLTANSAAVTVKKAVVVANDDGESDGDGDDGDGGSGGGDGNDDEGSDGDGGNPNNPTPTPTPSTPTPDPTPTTTPFPDTEWFSGNRVHLHTEQYLGNIIKSFGTSKLLSELQQTGAKTFEAHLDTKVNPGFSDSPSDILVPLPADSKRPQVSTTQAKQFIQDIHALGIKFISYNSLFIVNKPTAEAHPELVAKNPKGKPILYVQTKNANETYYLDITDPAVKTLIKDRLLQQASFGADAFYFDEAHLPTTGAFGTNLERMFVERKGKPAPKTTNPSNPAFIEYMRFQGEAIADVFDYLKKEVKMQYPNVVFIVGSQPYVSQINYRFPSSVVRVADSTKSEFKHPIFDGWSLNIFKAYPDLKKPDDDIRLAYGWTLLRDTNRSAPPHIWTNQLSSRDAALSFVYSLTSYDMIANLHMNAEVFSTGLFNSYLPWYQEALTFGRTIAQYTHNNSPVKFATVHWSESRRNARGNDFKKAWLEVIDPSIKVFGKFVRKGLPVEITTDEDLTYNYLKKYKVLYLPNPGELTDGQTAAVRQFKNGGGIVINGNTNIDNLKAAAPLSLESYNGKVHLVSYDDSAKHRMLLTLNNDFSTPTKPPKATNVTVRVNMKKKILKAYDLLTGQTVTFTADGANAQIINVGSIDLAKFIVVEYE